MTTIEDLTLKAEREQREQDARELEAANIEARLLSSEIERLSLEMRALPAKLQSVYVKHSALLKKIADLQERLNPAPSPQLAAWYSDGSLANRLVEALQ